MLIFSASHSSICLISSSNTSRSSLTTSHSGGERCTHVTHGRSRMTIDPRIPTMPGQRTSGFHRPGKHCLHQARRAVKCWASRMECEVHPAGNREGSRWSLGRRVLSPFKVHPTCGAKLLEIRMEPTLQKIVQHKSPGGRTAWVHQSMDPEDCTAW